MRRALLVLAAVAGVLAASPAVASGATTIPFADCGLADGFQCARLTVPVDRMNSLAGTIDLYLERKAAATQPATSAVIALAGGPGQSATPFASAFAQALAPALGTRDLVVYDQRGTGRSGFLTCPSAERNAATFADYSALCATELGASRSDYSTRDTVDDIEAIRQALGVDKVSIFGVSYGTYVAQLYARRYPTHTESLILDSSVPPAGVDPFDRASYRAIKSELESLCSEGRCRGITSNVLDDASRVASRAYNGGVPVTFVDPQAGRPVRLHVSAVLLFDLFEEGLTFDEASRARLPAALVSSLHGDPYPLGQVVATLIGPDTSGDSDPTAMSDALNLATFCTDTTFPWDAADSLTTREQKVSDTIGRLPLDVAAPFPRGVLLGAGTFNECLGWPSTTPVTVPGPSPDVPVLLLSGRDDMLTPYEDAVVVAQQFPHATLLRVPNTGHSVATTAPGAADVCVEAAFERFFAGQPVAECPATPPDLLPTRVDPTSLKALRPTGAKGLAGQTVTAALDTLRDVRVTLSSREPLTGLRGGTMSGTTSELTLDNVEFVPGVVVSGSVDWESGVATLQLSGAKGAHGTLRVERGAGVSGRLAGVPIKGAASAALLAPPLGFGTRGASLELGLLVPRDPLLDLLR